MKKLDEIMELMTDEMADFKAAILELELLSKQLLNLSIPITTEALEKNLNIFLEKQEEENRLKDEVLKEIEKKLKHARIIPNYLLILFGALGIIALSLLGYFGYTARALEKEKFEIYRIILESENDSYQQYLSINPEIKDDYCEWLEGKK
ncbi:DUF6730 family protein [Gillisia hiemivivida]|uniref:Uncharacterized protein n=1 Tax=Gillisia hiemivivida TaxID=291190 RepID=A0A5C6ZXQ6_9FLAO|nr:DUF6730 family protein [Gillisia hiemivivida]TXD95498.1 hypothetical protein ES724_00235 [Gillisia hiemivivida]